MEEEKSYPTDRDLSLILRRMGLPQVAPENICPFLAAEDGAPYAVWRIDTEEGPLVLKRAKGREPELYRTFFRREASCVPALVGSCAYGGSDYLLTRFCPGEDLRRCDRPRLKKALDALIELQDPYWQPADGCGDEDAFSRSLESVQRRGRYLGSALLEQAYARFVDLYTTVPRTLCHGDLLPFNVLVEDRAVLIDWEEGGLLPYPVSLARLIAHGREEEDAFFHMTQADRSFAVEYYYDRLVHKHGVPQEEYRRTLDHFLFYEYCEWVMVGNRYGNREDERYVHSLKLAQALTPRLLQKK